jgi:hypothetical protein
MASTWSDTGQPRHGLDGSDRSRAFASPAMASTPASPSMDLNGQPRPATASPRHDLAGANLAGVSHRDPIALYFAYKDLIAFCFLYKDPIAFYFCIQGSLYKY